jgi:hypothetical protein
VLDRGRLHEGLAARRYWTEAKRAVPGENQREILLALSLSAIRFLHMESGFKRKPDTEQVIQSKKYKNESIRSQKRRKSVIFCIRGIAANSNAVIRDFTSYIYDEVLGPMVMTRIIRLLEVLLHAANNLGGWSAKHIHQVILQSFRLSDKPYGLNQLRYDLRNLKSHGLIERDGSRYAYRLTSKGFKVALLFLS